MGALSQHSLVSPAILVGLCTAISLVVVSPGLALDDQIDEQLDIRPHNRTQGQARDVADQLLRLGQREVEAKNHEAGMAAWYRAIDIYSTLGDIAAASLAYDYLARVYVDLDRYVEAEDVIRRRLAIALDRLDFQGQAYGFNNLGNVLVQRGHLRQAEEAFQSALAIATEIGDAEAMGLSLSNLGLISKLQGDLQKAITHYEAAVEFRLRAGDLIGQAHSSNHLGQLRYQLGQEMLALRSFLLARAAALEADDISTLLPALDGLITLYRDRDDIAQARRYLNERVMATQPPVATPAQQLGTFIHLGDYYTQVEDFVAAAEAYRTALILAQQLADTPREAVVLNRLRSVQLQAGGKGDEI